MKKIAQQLWIAQEGENYRIGMTPELQDDAGDISYVNIFDGDSIQVDETLLNLEASKAAIEIPSPLAGRVLEINQAAMDSPELLNSEDAKDHWIAVLTDVDPTAFDAL
ncbi:TPA: glycine cleavage system protein H [Streptococcus suis]